MKLNRAAIKQSAKLDIRETKPNIILFTLLYLVVCYVLEVLVSKLSGYSAIMTAVMNSMVSGSADAADAADVLMYPAYAVTSVTPIARIIIVAISIMSMMLSAGYTLFALNAVRRRAPAYGNLFDPFGMFFKILWLNILMGIFVTLWTMLFFFPGIVAAYRYSMALYVRLDNPDMSALDCIRASKDLTRGHKGELFVLDLSFIGWAILSAVPLVSLWVTPYMELTKARYYCELCRERDGGYNGGNNYGEDDFRARAQDVPWEDAGN